MSTAAYDEAALPVSMICILPPLTGYPQFSEASCLDEACGLVCWRCLTTQQLRSHQYGGLASILLGLDEGPPRVRGALGQVKDRPLARRLDLPSTGQQFNLDRRHLTNYRLRLLLHCGVRWQTYPDRKTARPLSTLGGEEPLNDACSKLGGA